MEVCPDREFGNTENYMCEGCSEGCATCTHTEFCTTCDDYYQLVSPVTTSAFCQVCTDKCVHCEGDLCIECDQDWFINFDGTCIQDCGDGNFANLETGRCDTCHEACSLCTLGDEVNC